VLVCPIASGGWGGRGGSPARAAILRAAAAALHHVLQRPDVDPNRVFVGGRSLGSGPACHLAAQHPVAGLLLAKAFTNLCDVAERHYWFMPARLLLRHSFPNLVNLAKVSAPVFIYHTRDDEIVPVDMAETLASAVRGPVTKEIRDAGGHNTPMPLSPLGPLGAKLRAFFAQ
jgi:pimeloyl-ACP methyl ester carboxylesterase